MYMCTYVHMDHEIFQYEYVTKVDDRRLSVDRTKVSSCAEVRIYRFIRRKELIGVFSPPPRPSLFGPTTLLTGMTGISLHMQWPLTSQLRGSVSQREQLFFYVMDQNPHPFRCLPRIHE
jgi:hypothetical protein